jgi:hypothetical protein
LLQAVQGGNTWPITTRHLIRNLKTVFKRRMPSGMIIFSMLIMRCSHDHHRGKLIFVGHSPAQELLPNYIKNGAYPFLIPMELWNPCPEYKIFDLTTFRQNIYQEEIRCNKFINWCELKWQQAKERRTS